MLPSNWESLESTPPRAVRCGCGLFAACFSHERPKSAPVCVAHNRQIGRASWYGRSASAQHLVERLWHDKPRAKRPSPTFARPRTAAHDAGRTVRVYVLISRKDWRIFDRRCRHRHALRGTYPLWRPTRDTALIRFRTVSVQAVLAWVRNRERNLVWALNMGRDHWRAR
jgi:hypothetical protein